MGEKYRTEQIIEALHLTNGLIYLAARRMGCAPNTIYKRAKRSPTVRQAIDDSRAELVDLGEAKLREAILRGEPWAVALVLKTLGKTRGYVERQELTGAEGGPIEHKDVNLDAGERDRAISALAAVLTTALHEGGAGGAGTMGTTE